MTQGHSVTAFTIRDRKLVFLDSQIEVVIIKIFLIPLLLLILLIETLLYLFISYWFFAISQESKCIYVKHTDGGWDTVDKAVITFLLV